MKTFNTFAANSPMHTEYHSPRVPSSNLFNPSNADSRDQQMQKTAYFIKDTFKRTSGAIETKKEEAERESQDSFQNNHSEVSLLLSQVSVPPPSKPLYDAQRLFSLENNITQHILELRQQKITLMQQLSLSLDKRNLYDHYLLKKSKEDDRQTNYDSRMQHSLSRSAQLSPQKQIVPTNISALILRRNQELHRKLKELKVKEEIFGQSMRQAEANEEDNHKFIDEIMEIRQLNNNLQKQITNKLSRVSKNEAIDSRFVTFQPQDRAKHQELLNSSGELDFLKERYAKLSEQNNSVSFKLSPQEEDYVQALRRENQQLLRQAEEMLKRKEGARLPQLREKLDQNERQKVVFLQELQNFKQKMRVLKDQNKRLSQQLNNQSKHFSYS